MYSILQVEKCMFNTTYYDPKIPNFAEGDEIEFEIITEQGSAVPRWDMNNSDKGSTTPPTFAKGEVTLITPEYICVEFQVENFIGTGQATFPNYNHKKYTSWQWSRSGFLKKTKDIKCECGAETVKTTHSTWCEKFNKFKKNKKERR